VENDLITSCFMMVTEPRVQEYHFNEHNIHSFSLQNFTIFNIIKVIYGRRFVISHTHYYGFSLSVACSN